MSQYIFTITEDGQTYNIKIGTTDLSATLKQLKRTADKVTWSLSK